MCFRAPIRCLLLLRASLSVGEALELCAQRRLVRGQGEIYS